MLAPADLFDLAKTDHAALFDGTTHVWDALNHIGTYIQSRLQTDLPPNATEHDLHTTVVVGDDVHIGEGVTIHPGVYIEGPSLICAGATIRHGAYVRKNTVVAAGSMVGHASETKNAVLLEGAQAPHFAYVGDSILGMGVNLGAGTKLSNFPMTSMGTDPRPIAIPVDGERLETGLTKFGAVLGDGVQLGCNCVTNPGVVIGPRTLVYTLTALAKGYYPADKVIKLRQTHEVVDRY